MTLSRRSAWSATSLVAVLVVAAGIAVAGPTEAADGTFGQHVRVCAQDMGFDGRHNPGMHRGASQWHQDHHDDLGHHC